jgi:hypothetical protein
MEASHQANPQGNQQARGRGDSDERRQIEAAIQASLAESRAQSQANLNAGNQGYQPNYNNSNFVQEINIPLDRQVSEPYRPPQQEGQFIPANDQIVFEPIREGESSQV